MTLRPFLHLAAICALTVLVFTLPIAFTLAATLLLAVACLASS